MAIIDWIATHINIYDAIGGFFIAMILLILAYALWETRESEMMPHREHVNCRTPREAKEFIAAVGEKNVFKVEREDRWIVVTLKEGVYLKEDDCDDFM